MKIEPAPTPLRLIPSTRFLLALLVCFAFVVQYAQRINLSIAIVCMVNKTKSNFELEPKNNMIQNHTISTVRRTSLFFNEKQFFWNEWDQQIILGSYWAGYLLTLIPSGWLSMTMGAKRMCAMAICISSLATIALTSIYFLKNNSLIIVVSLRILIGAAHGTLFPVTYTLWSQWAVPNERGTLTSIGFCGTNIGTSFIVLVGGVLCRYMNSGWIHIFLLSGILGFVWLPLWMWQVSDTPEHHRSISNTERDYIQNIIGKNTQNKNRRPISIGSLPWKNIVRSKAVIALVISELCNLFGLFFFLSNFGKILTEIHRIPTQYTGYILACGFMFMMAGSLSAGITADNLVRKNLISLNNVRKLFNALTTFIPCLCMIAFCFCDEKHQILGVLTVIVFLLGSGFAYGSGYIVIFSDIVPAYSALIFGIATTISSFNAVIGNLIAGILIKNSTLHDWRKLFILFFIVYLVGGIIFLIFGSALPEPWGTFKAQQQVQEEQEAKQSEEEMLPIQKQQETNEKDVKTDQNLYVNA
ncbi:unnamed protein product [Adineta steineri]|uniref:Major facilitator superfamily (MFS) profile domain-containing protein n=1 Tax=Adineta steineri TaxID=433720 RepID=A0A819LSJ7_9BILA|nr:unnamed protein product [Adineta steineri]